MFDDLDDDTKDSIHGMLYNHLMENAGKRSVMDKFGPKELPVHGLAIEHTKVEPIEGESSMADMMDPDHDGDVDHIPGMDSPMDEDEDVPNLVKRLRSLKK